MKWADAGGVCGWGSRIVIGCGVWGVSFESGGGVFGIARGLGDSVVGRARSKGGGWRYSPMGIVRTSLANYEQACTKGVDCLLGTQCNEISRQAVPFAWKSFRRASVRRREWLDASVEMRTVIGSITIRQCFQDLWHPLLGAPVAPLQHPALHCRPICKR